MSKELPTILYIQAGLRLCQTQNIPAYVRKKGDADRGMILIKTVKDRQHCTVWGQERNGQQDLRWVAQYAGTEPDADAFLERAEGYDPDLWIIEIETKEDKNPFDTNT